MAGLKETPRQKMIGMMYLVLTALLALNVQKEVLNAFVELNNGIEKTTDSNTGKIQSLYADFKFANNLDPQKTGPMYNAAQEIRSFSSSMHSFLDSIKSTLISETEGIPFEVADTISLSNVEMLENYDEVTRLMIGPKNDASKGIANQIRNKFKDYESKINEIMSQHNLLSVEIPIDFSDHPEEEYPLWEVRTFYDTPLAGAVSILSKYIGDITNAEFLSVSRLLSKVDGEDIPVDTVLAKVIPKSNYVLLGEEYQSQIFLGAYSTTIDPVIRMGTLNADQTGFIGDFEELEIKNGSAIYQLKTNQEGLHEYSGIVTIKDKQGNNKNYPFESSYLVARPSAVISPTSMNVLYKGLKNPLAVSVPGIPDEDIVLNTNGHGSASKTGKGTYDFVVNNGAAQDITLTVSAKMEDGSMRAMGTMPFRTKYLPKPNARIGDIEDNGSMRKSELIARQGIIGFYSKDFIFNLKLTVVSFKAKVYSGNTSPVERVSNRNKWSPEMAARFAALKVNDEVQFYDIMVLGEDGKRHKVNPIIIKIKN